MGWATLEQWDRASGYPFLGNQKLGAPCENDMVPITPQIEPIWKHVQDEAVMVHAYWHVFEQLFAQPPETLDVVLPRLGVPIFRVFDLDLPRLSEPKSGGPGPAGDFRHSVYVG